MSRLVQLEMGGRKFWVETKEVFPPVVDKADADSLLRMKSPNPAELGEKVETLVKDLADGLAVRLMKAAESAKPKTVTLEFSVGLSGELGIPFVASGRAEGGIAVALEWEL